MFVDVVFIYKTLKLIITRQIFLALFKIKDLEIKFCKILSLLFLLCCAWNAQGQDTYRDNFNTQSYNNNNGTSNFLGPWNEINDNNNVNNGRVRITGNELRFEDITRNDERLERSLNINGASSAVLSMDWRTVGLDGSGTVDSEQLNVQISSDGVNFVTIGTFTGNQSGFFSENIAAYASANTTIRFTNVSTWDFGDWESGEFVYIDNVEVAVSYGPVVSINDVTVAEEVGFATFTVTLNQLVLGGTSVDFTTSDGSAVQENDYTNSTGTINFIGLAGETQTISIPIRNDSFGENTENFFVNLSGATNGVQIADNQGRGDITDTDPPIQNNVPLTLFQEFSGYYDYTTTGGTLRTQDNNTNACSITTSSSNTLLTQIPVGATIERAYLYWSHSSQSLDDIVTFEGQNVFADVAYGSNIGSGRQFYGYRSDVTAIVQGIADPSTNTFDFSGLTIDNSNTYCSSATVLGGWSLMVFYEELSLPAVTINLYQGFSGESNSSSSYTLSGFFAIGANGSKTTVLSWEGDQTLANNELLTVTAGSGLTLTLSGDGDNNGITRNNPFNSTIYDNTANPVINNANSYGVDLDTYDISAAVQPGESSVTTTVQSGQDYVIVNAVLLKVPSNLISGRIYEDVNYGGGAGQDYINSGGLPIEGTRVELYNNSGVLDDVTTTGSNGRYVFGGMANGTYRTRVVNNTVNSNRGGGTACATCMPIQTYRRFYTAAGFNEVPNEVGGANPAGQDSGNGILAGAQSVSSVFVLSNGIVGVDFGYNFNTIVNTNESGQGSLEQFIVNSNNLDETGLDISSNSIFDPAPGEDTSVFMIPPTGDALGRTADAKYVAGIFEIDVLSGDLSNITGDNTKIDGRTQTAYSGDTNAGTIGSGGVSVGVAGGALPNYLFPEIQLNKPAGEIFVNEGSNIGIRNLSLITNDKSAILMENGSLTISNNLIGVTASGANGGTILTGIEIKDGNTIIEGNYIATNADNGIFIDGGTATTISNNHFTNNGSATCQPSIKVRNGNGIVVQTNLIENSGGLGIDAENVSSPISIEQNTITTSGVFGGGCLAGILLGDDNAAVTGNVIHNNGGAGLELRGNSSGNLISRNSFYANGTAGPALGIDLGQNGVTLNDNGDGDNGPNGLLNFPIIETVATDGANLFIRGWARPGAIIELFISDITEGTASTGDNTLGYITDYGEGQTYVATVIEGSANDLSGVVSSYADVDGNADNTNRFRFSIPIPGGLAIGQKITTTATVSNSTSEFSPLTEIKVKSIITNRRITYRIKRN